MCKSNEFSKYEKKHKLESSKGCFEWLKTSKKTSEGVKVDKWENVLRYTCDSIELAQQQLDQLVTASKFIIHNTLPPTQFVILIKGDKDELSTKFVLNLLQQLKPNGAEKCRYIFINIAIDFLQLHIIHTRKRI